MTTYSSPLLIAEVGINHNGDVETAEKLILSAHAAGADFIKLQSFVMEDFFAPDLDYYEESASYALTFEEQSHLFELARNKGIPLITTPFETKSLAFLDRFDLPAYKIASMDCDNYPLIRKVAEKGKTVFLSTGMATLGEIEKAVKTILETGNTDIHLLHCVSNYPTAPEEVNLAFMLKLRDTFGLKTGLSDHTVGLQSAFMAATLGASAIEKHYTLDRTLADAFPGADHELSINEEELRTLREFCDAVPVIMGDPARPLSANETQGRAGMRRGFYARREITKGEILNEDNLVALRPVRGVPVSLTDAVMGSQAARSIKNGAPLQFGDFGKQE
ncbi:N-acetylneuraminate synthase family protein [Pseudodesulfovibrio sp.]|uniref:N-acetylneuraminate synthase family protein n=1 Tax=unclassified Pseudodesulfovibrio TaxID=2661612 RepID=UPI003B0073D2